MFRHFSAELVLQNSLCSDIFRCFLEYFFNFVKILKEFFEISNYATSIFQSFLQSFLAQKNCFHWIFRYKEHIDIQIHDFDSKTTNRNFYSIAIPLKTNMKPFYDPYFAQVNPQGIANKQLQKYGGCWYENEVLFTVKKHAAKEIVGAIKLLKYEAVSKLTHTNLLSNRRNNELTIYLASPPFNNSFDSLRIRFICSSRYEFPSRFTYAIFRRVYSFIVLNYSK